MRETEYIQTNKEETRSMNGLLNYGPAEHKDRKSQGEYLPGTHRERGFSHLVHLKPESKCEDFLFKK